MVKKRDNTVGASNEFPVDKDAVNPFVTNVEPVIWMEDVNSAMIKIIDIICPNLQDGISLKTEDKIYDDIQVVLEKLCNNPYYRSHN